MSKIKRSHQHGFSLVELLMTLLIMSLIMTAVYSLYSTNMKSAYTQDEVVDVQQNIRIAMMVISQDIKMAGMLINYADSASPKYPVNSYTNDTGPNSSDSITLNTASASSVYAKLIADVSPSSSSDVFGVVSSAHANQPKDLERFSVNDIVRIFRPFDNSQPAVVIPQTDATFKVISKNAASAMTLADLAGSSMSGALFKRGDVIAKVNNTTTAAPFPNNTISFSLVNGVGGATPNNADCPKGQRCIVQNINGEGEKVIAQNISNLQFKYILDDGSAPTDAPTSGQMSTIKAVIVTINGSTFKTTNLNSGQVKNREMTNIVKLRNRR
jgi:prepilin-type N-terminal cleavage/methylation domain-containing protein